MKTSMSESLFSSMAMATGYNELEDEIGPSSVPAATGLDEDDEERARISFEINFINDGQRRWAKRTKRRERRPKARFRKSEERPSKDWMGGGRGVEFEPALIGNETTESKRSTMTER